MLIWSFSCHVEGTQRVETSALPLAQDFGLQDAPEPLFQPPRQDLAPQDARELPLFCFQATELVGGDAGLGLEEFVERGDGQEVEPVTYLLDGHVGIPQQVLCLEHEEGVNPVGGRLSAHILDHGCQIFGRHVHFVSVETHSLLGQEILRNKRKKFFKFGLTARLDRFCGTQTGLLIIPYIPQQTHERRPYGTYGFLCPEQICLVQVGNEVVVVRKNMFSLAVYGNAGIGKQFDAVLEHAVEIDIPCLQEVFRANHKYRLGVFQIVQFAFGNVYSVARRV